MSIYEIISIIVAVILGVLSLILNTNKKLNSNVADYIAKTEYLFSGIAKSGDKKFAWVADRLYELIPAVLRPIFTRAVVEGIVQRTFEAMEKYGKSQIGKTATSGKE